MFTKLYHRAEKQKEETKKHFGQVLLQGHTTCTKELLFECPRYTGRSRYIKIRHTVAIMPKPVL
jgi:hypothetical protein